MRRAVAREPGVSTRGYDMDKPKRQSRGRAGTIVTLFLMLLAALGAFLRWGPADGTPGLRQEIQAAEQLGVGSPESPSPSPATWRTEPHRRSNVRQTKSSDRPSHSTKQPASQRSPSKIALPTFPTAAAIPVGMEKSKLLARFGSPNIVTTAVEQGWKTETYLYVRPDPGTQTVVKLRSGRVVEAASNPY